MRVAITGHTGGLGLAFLHYFQNKNSLVLGFSRSNGYDISKIDDIQRILDQVKYFDIFVNNAYHENQLVLLEKIFSLWRGQDKLIINVSSRYINEPNSYSHNKSKQDEFCQSKVYQYPKILNLKPGLVDTPRVKHINGPKLTTAQVIDTVDYCLQNNVQSITFGF